MAGTRGFLDELRERGVVRAGLVYLAAAFALIEFADIAVPRLALPDGVVTVLLWLAIAGFPLTLGVAWVVELRAQPESRSTPRRWLSPSTVVPAALLVAAGIGMGFWWGDPGQREGVAPVVPAAVDPEARAPAVAVLRFLDPGGGDDLFGAGLAEEVGTVLARFPGIRVISPSATSYFDEVSNDIRVLDEELGVAYLLRGTVQRSEDRVRVAAQLLDAATGNQLWGERYQAELTPARLFETQERIAEQVASTIGDSSGVVARRELRHTRRRGTESLEAYECVLLGQAYLNVHSREVHERARSCLARAVELDPGYADAWAHLAYMYREEYLHRYPGGPDPLGRSLRASDRAIDLDPNNAMAYFSRGFALGSLYEFDLARTALERVAALAPNDTAMLGGTSIYMAHLGQWERALELADRVEQLNPLNNGWFHYTRVLDAFWRGDHEAALAHALQLRNTDETQERIHLAVNYVSLGRVEEAHQVAERLVAENRDFADDPSEAMRRIFLRDVAIERYTLALRLAGIAIEPGAPARFEPKSPDYNR